MVIFYTLKFNCLIIQSVNIQDNKTFPDLDDGF